MCITITMTAPMGDESFERIGDLVQRAVHAATRVGISAEKTDVSRNNATLRQSPASRP